MRLIAYNIFALIIFLNVIFLCANCYANPKLFNKNETENDGISEFPKWVDALKKHSEEKDVYEKKCLKNKKDFYCNIKSWQDFVSSLSKNKKMTQLKKINSYINKKKYTIDMDNWGLEDYWESPGEFLFKTGDCEDYAIIKYLSLKALGFSADDMRVLILYDNNLGAYHSVLAVYSGDDIFILDNQISSVIRDKKIYHYSPIFSLNEEHWWRYL